MTEMASRAAPGAQDSPAPRQTSSTRSFDERLFRLGLALILLAILVGLAEPVLALFRLVPRSYNEGWNAFWAAVAARGGILYANPDSLVANNYPPLSFHVIGLVGRLLGDNVIAGRLVSLASLGVVTAATYVWLRVVGAARETALAGAAFCLVTFVYFGDNYIATDDPQMLAHALMLTGLAVLWHGNFSPPAVVASAVLMLLGGFTKHLLIPLPVATTLWLAMHHRRQLLAWFACFAVGLPLGFGITSLTCGNRFLPELISARVYLPERALDATLTVCEKFLPLLGVAALPVVGRLRAATALPAPVRFALLYLALSLAVGAIASGGVGVVRNAFFDLLIAASLSAALGVEMLLAKRNEHRFAGASAGTVAVAILGFGIATHAAISLPGIVRNIRDLGAIEHDTRTAVQIIAKLGHGHAACETLQLCYWAHGDFTVDFFNYGQKLETGALPMTSCTESLRRGEFPVLQLESPDHPTTERLSSCSQAIQQYYTVVHRSRVGTLLVPRQSLVLDHDSRQLANTTG